MGLNETRAFQPTTATRDGGAGLERAAHAKPSDARDAADQVDEAAQTAAGESAAGHKRPFQDDGDRKGLAGNKKKRRALDLDAPVSEGSAGGFASARPSVPPRWSRGSALAAEESGAAVLSPLSVASAEQIRQHIRDVRREVFLRPMLAIVTRLMFHRANHGLFNERVDPVLWNIPHYFEVVKNPMDLSSVKNKCLNLEYASADACAADVRLVFQNACLFNPPGHVVHEAAKELLQEFEAEYARHVAKTQALDKRRDEHSCPFCLANVCGVCNEKCINFEPPFVQCSGPCRQRIKRHSVYYKTQSGSHHWCAKCYTSLPKVVTLPSAALSTSTVDASSAPANGEQEQQTTTLAKNTLLKAKFLDQLTEPWVQCDKCSGWVHQICVLFNACENADDAADDDAPYMCPLCRLKELDEEKENWDSGMSPSETSVDEFPIANQADNFDFIRSHSPVLKLRKLIGKDFTRVLGFDQEIKKRIAGYCCGSDSIDSERTGNELLGFPRSAGVVKSRDLADCALSRYMQKWIYQYLMNIGEMEAAESVVVKVASSIKTSCVVSPVVREHFRSESLQYPEEIDYTSKAIFVFQAINGIEVCIFSMYVQEYDAQCNFAANRNRAYIAYIDSLVYMRPRHVRTNLFHQILISYLANCKDRSFEYAHIWACPTTRGGDFIYWCHPTFQKNPGKDRLLQWYLGMAAKGRRSGVVFDCKDLYACEFESLETSLATRLPPYFEGDYWPSEVERLAASPPKRGKLSKEAYAESLKGQRFRKRLVDSVKGARDSLFVIALQPACSGCRRLIVKPTAGSTSDDTQSELCGACRSGGSPSVTTPGNGATPRSEEDAELSCPFVDYRPNLLKNCEERHYQFDSYRRAKYSTMMLIYEIHSSQRARQ